MKPADSSRRKFRARDWSPLDSRNHILLANEPAWLRFQEAVTRFMGLGEAPLSVPQKLDALTAREREILQLVSQGLANRQIASQLSISDKTVRNHLIRIFDKLGVNSRAQAIVRARAALQ